ncbi:hypothetical protein C3E79_08815 [Corynebacterium liangguodongii]|uniref:Uncharacterized protein n=1 Tax=Corynebacterium liangguodongii TaxID=2079535 RepID=A0A2S0WH84_9CORY|nr:hypothetical protein [Corynebacterium liangguodongii]AWB85129.1 hypothetical protein C3E79_08815 [Corynebacterium liangguodongii]PWB98905.1 hypothetical protein DF219_09570 [Corynebacterium liangguodongii]
MRVRAWHIALLALAVVCSLLLAYWQWARYQSGTGTFQNLGYALQWPFFGAFFVYAYRAGLRMENDKIDAENSAAALDDLYAADLARFGGQSGGPTTTDEAEATAISEDFLPPRPHLDVEEFNELNRPTRGRPHVDHTEESDTP